MRKFPLCTHPSNVWHRRAGKNVEINTSYSLDIAEDKWVRSNFSWSWMKKDYAKTQMDLPLNVGDHLYGLHLEILF